MECLWSNEVGTDCLQHQHPLIHSQIHACTMWTVSLQQACSQLTKLLQLGQLSKGRWYLTEHQPGPADI